MEVLAAQKKLGALHGIYAEPSSAASLCGVEQLCSRGLIGSGEIVVAVITGSGFREGVHDCNSLRAAKTAMDSKSGMAVLEELLRH